MRFGDMYLEELRRDRRRSLGPVGMLARFPGWATDTASRATETVDAGVAALAVSVAARRLPAEFLGRAYDKELLSDLPRGWTRAVRAESSRPSSPTTRASPRPCGCRPVTSSSRDHALLSLHAGPVTRTTPGRPTVPRGRKA